MKRAAGKEEMRGFLPVVGNILLLLPRAGFRHLAGTEGGDHAEPEAQDQSDVEAGRNHI